jgi:hypothetical protein
MPSSVIASFHYDPKRSALVVVFVSGMVYEYLGVPETVYQAMKSARSRGTFLNARIKPHYTFRKVSS